MEKAGINLRLFEPIYPPSERLRKFFFRLVRYFEDQDRYADLINGFLFHGRQIVSGEDIQEVFGFVQRPGDKNAEKRFTEENEEKFCVLDEDAFDVIVTITGADELERVKEQYREEGRKA